MRHWMVFKFKGTALNRLKDAYYSRRNYCSLEALLQQIGRYCFDCRSDGLFSAHVLRSFSLPSHFRTRLHAHLPALVACGAIEVCRDGRYRYIGFHEHNLCAEEMQKRNAQTKAYWSGVKSSWRAARHGALEYTQAMKAQQQKTADSGDNKAVLKNCPAQPTKSTPPCADLSATNFNHAAYDLSEVDSPKIEPDEPVHCFDPELAALIGRAQQKAQEHALLQNEAIPEIAEEEIAAVERALSDSATISMSAPAIARTKSVHDPKYAVRLARKPKVRTGLTESVIEKALHDLQVCLSPQATCAWWKDMHALGTSAEDLGYAVWSVLYQRKKRKIHNPLAYAQRILAAQTASSVPVLL